MTQDMNEKENYSENASRIVKLLAAKKEPLTQVDLKKELGIDWNTVRTNLSFLEKCGRVHVQYIGGNRYYGLNGKGVHQDHMKLTDTEHLWLDIFEPTLNLKEHFIRIKQTRLKGFNTWEPTGTISVSKSQLTEFINKLTTLKGELEKDYPSG